MAASEDGAGRYWGRGVYGFTRYTQTLTSGLPIQAAASERMSSLEKAMLRRGFLIISAVILISQLGLLACRRDEPVETREASASQSTQSPGEGSTSPIRRSPTTASAQPNPTEETATAGSSEPASLPATPHTSAPQGEEAPSPVDLGFSAMPPSETSIATTAASAQPEPASGTDSGDTEASPKTASDTADAAVRATLAEVERDMYQRWGQIQSLTAKMNTNFERMTDPKTVQQGAGTYDCLKRDGKLLVRSYHFNSIGGANDNEEIPWVLTGEEYTKISDGRFVYSIRRDHAKKTGTKAYARFPQVLYVGGPGPFFLLRRLTDLKQLADSKVEEHDVVVFSGITPDSDRRLFEFFLDREAGIMRQLIIENREQKSKFTFTLSEVEFNVDFEEDHFTFVPPEGVEIVDLTQPQPTVSSPSVETSEPTDQPTKDGTP